MPHGDLSQINVICQLNVLIVALVVVS